MSNETQSTNSRRWATPVALILGVIIFAVSIAGYAWQTSESNSQLDEAATHTTAAVHLEDAGVEGAIAGEFLANYVAEGDETLIPRIQEHAAAGVAGLTQAISSSGSDDLRQLALSGAGLAEGAGSIIAFRQAGDVPRAAAALQELGPAFDDFGASLQTSIDNELAEAASLANSSDSAESTATWLLITALAAGFATGVGLLWLLARSLRKRRAPESPSPA
jgi:hypothetical protein